MFCLSGESLVTFDRQGIFIRATLGIQRGLVCGVTFVAKVAEHVVPASSLTFAAQGRDINRADHDFLSWASIGLCQDVTVVIYNHAGAGPTEGRVVAELGPLITGHHIGHVFQNTKIFYFPLKSNF